MGSALADDEAVAAFARDGVVCLRQVLDAAEVAVAAEAIQAVLARPGPLAQVASTADDPGAFTEDRARCPRLPLPDPSSARAAQPRLPLRSLTHQAGPQRCKPVAVVAATSLHRCGRDGASRAAHPVPGRQCLSALGRRAIRRSYRLRFRCCSMNAPRMPG